MTFQPIRTDPPADLVRRITFVPFLADGRCVLIDEPGGPALPSGEVLDGEDYLLDTVLRIPLETAGFRYQRFHPFGLDRDHLYAWIEGGPYTGGKPHRTAVLSFCSAKEAVRRLDEHDEPVLAAAVQAAAASYGTLDEQAFYADNRRTLEPAYLRGTTPQQGSGFGGDEREWEQARRHLTEVISGGGTFLDVGCANGLLMESVAAWCAERGLAVEPYGVDISPALAELARRRLPRGTAASGPATPGRRGMRFDYVHILLDCVPRARRADLVRHHLAQPSGRARAACWSATTPPTRPRVTRTPPRRCGSRLPRRPDQRRRPPRPAARPYRLDNRAVKPGGRLCRR